MNIRIRYYEVRNNILVSRRNFTTLAGQTVVVELNLVEKKFKVRDASTGTEVVSGGNTKNAAVLKIQAKKALIALGVQFNEEHRSRDDQRT